MRTGDDADAESAVETVETVGFFDRVSVLLTGNLGEDPTDGGEWVRGRVAVQRGLDPVWLSLFARGDSRGALWRQRGGQKVLLEGSLNLRTQRVRGGDGKIVELVVVDAVNVTRVYPLDVRKRDEGRDEATVATTAEPLPDGAGLPAGSPAGLVAHLGGWPPAVGFELPPIPAS